MAAAGLADPFGGGGCNERRAQRLRERLEGHCGDVGVVGLGMLQGWKTEVVLLDFRGFGNFSAVGTRAMFGLRHRLTST